MSTVTTNQLDTHYVERGSGTPLVLIHEAFADSRVWGPVMSHLSDDFRVVAYDLRGHGQTGESDRQSYSVKLLAQDLRSLVERLDMDSPTVCGVSLGGMVALTYAKEYPEHVANVITSGTVAPETRSPPSTVQRAFLTRVLPGIAKLIGYRSTRTLVDKIESRSAGEAAGDKQQRESIWGGNPPTMTPAEFKKIGRATLSFGADGESSPTSTKWLALYGEHELDRFASSRKFIAENISSAMVETVPDAGHPSHIDCPDDFADRVRRFARQSE